MLSAAIAVPQQQNGKRKMTNVHENAFDMAKMQESINSLSSLVISLQNKCSSLETKLVENDHKVENTNLKDEVEKLKNTIEGKIAKKKPGPKKDKPTVYNLYMKFKTDEMRKNGEIKDDGKYKIKFGECSSLWSKERDEYLEANNEDYKAIDDNDEKERKKWRTKNKDKMENFNNVMINKYNLK